MYHGARTPCNGDVDEKSLRDRHADATRAALLAAARATFAENGYARTSLDEIVGRARVTKGALYHHFRNKAALLEAVYTQMEEELVARVAAAVEAACPDPFASIVAALDAFLEASAEPAYVRVVLQEAPPVIGQQRGRAIDQRLGLALVESMMGALRAHGLLPDVSLGAMARIFLAATGEVALSMAHSDDPERARCEGRTALLALLEGLALRARIEP